MNNTYELVYASDFEEFFYTEDNEPVSEHTPVGVDITINHRGSLDDPPYTEVKFQLFDDIYWNPQFDKQINERKAV